MCVRRLIHNEVESICSAECLILMAHDHESAEANAARSGRRMRGGVRLSQIE